MSFTVGVVDLCNADPVKNATVAETYLNAFRLPGIVPQLIVQTDDRAAIARAVASVGLVALCGGEDLDPALYHERPSPRLGAVNRRRDAFEYAVLDAAVAQKKPVFGICRGIQTINVYFGGTLWQDLPSEFPVKGIPHRCSGTPYDSVQTLDLIPDGFLAKCCGAGRLGVNSLHHQAVKALAPGFQVVAYAPDGVIEAIEDPVRRVRAVQFHPERLVCRYIEWQKFFQMICKDAE